MDQRKWFTRYINNKIKAAQHVLHGELVRFGYGKRASLFVKERLDPLFTSVEIETTSICNRKCSYCPNSSEIRKQGYLPEAIFYKIIDELAELGYSGRLSTHLYGEPLLDKRLVTFISYARKKLPRVFIKLFTNGDFLTYNLLTKLDNAGVDVIRVSQHDRYPKGSLLKDLARYKKERGTSKIEYMDYFNNDDNLMNRGGLVEVKHDTKMKYCEFVSGITVDFQGNMILCCQDYHSQIKLGNLREEKIMDLWTKESYKALRDQLESGYWPTAMCRACVGLEPHSINQKSVSVQVDNVTLKCDG